MKLALLLILFAVNSNALELVTPTFEGCACSNTEASLKIENASQENVQVSLELSEFESWTSLELTKFYLRAGEDKKIPLSLDLPCTAGEYELTVTAKTSSSTASERVSVKVNDCEDFDLTAPKTASYCSETEGKKIPLRVQNNASSPVTLEVKASNDLMILEQGKITVLGNSTKTTHAQVTASEKASTIITVFTPRTEKQAVIELIPETCYEVSARLKTIEYDVCLDSKELSWILLENTGAKQNPVRLEGEGVHVTATVLKPGSKQEIPFSLKYSEPGRHAKKIRVESLTSSKELLAIVNAQDCSPANPLTPITEKERDPSSNEASTADESAPRNDSLTTLNSEESQSNESKFNPLTMLSSLSKGNPAVGALLVAFLAVTAFISKRLHDEKKPFAPAREEGYSRLWP